MEPEGSESTQVVVMKMAKSRFKGRVAVWTIFVVAVALIGAWGVMSSKKCVESREKFDKKMQGPPPVPKVEVVKPPVDPNATTATVYVMLSKRGSLTVGEETRNKINNDRVELPPGDHTIKAVVGKTTMTQAMTVYAGEEFMLYFDVRKGKVTIKRLAPVR